MELYHHGVLGMKWGVRRYQPYGSGGYSPKSKIINTSNYKEIVKTKPEIDKIVSSMTNDEKAKMGLHKSGDYLTLDDCKYVINRTLIKNGKTPVSFFDIFNDNVINLSVGTINSEQYRGKGYAKKAAMTGMDWLKKNKDILNKKDIVWGVRTDNESSIKIAEDLGFKIDDSSYSDDKKWVNYVYKL